MSALEKLADMILRRCCCEKNSENMVKDLESVFVSMGPTRLLATRVT